MTTAPHGAHGGGDGVMGMTEQERKEALDRFHGVPLDLDDLKWNFRALGVTCSEPKWNEDEYDDDGGDWSIDIDTGSLELTLHDSRTVFIGHSMEEVLWPESVEWKVLHLVMQRIGALDKVGEQGRPI